MLDYGSGTSQRETAYGAPAGLCKWCGLFSLKAIGFRRADGGALRYYNVGVEHIGISADSREEVEAVYERAEGMLTELRNRGLADALIVCCDGLKGLPESIRLTWPEAVVQTCVVHMVRNSLRYASRKHWQQITKQMRRVYTAPTVQAAEAAFADFSEQWRPVYPAMINAWEASWSEFVPFLEYPAELRAIVYTTNAIESLNARFRRAVRHRGHFPNEQAAMKVLYLVAVQRRKNRQDLSGKINGWKHILNTLHVHYGERITRAGQ